MVWWGCVHRQSVRLSSEEGLHMMKENCIKNNRNLQSESQISVISLSISMPLCPRLLVLYFDDGESMYKSAVRPFASSLKGTLVRRSHFTSLYNFPF